MILNDSHVFLHYNMFYTLFLQMPVLIKIYDSETIYFGLIYFFEKVFNSVTHLDIVSTPDLLKSIKNVYRKWPIRRPGWLFNPLSVNPTK